MEPEGGYRNSVKKSHNTIQFGLALFVSTSNLCFLSIQGLMVEPQDGRLSSELDGVVC